MINKAVITAAGKGTRQYPATNAVQKELFPLVDIDGITKPTIQIIVEQALHAGIDETCIVVNPGEAEKFKHHFEGLSELERPPFLKPGKEWGLRQSDMLDDLKRRIQYVEQTEQHGFGHAVWCAREFVGADPFLLLLGDHVYIADSETSCIAQAVQGFDQVGKTLFPVAPTPIDQLHLFGTLAGDPVSGNPGFYRVKEILEKPTPDVARSRLVTPDLPEDTFFTLFGMYVLSPKVMDILNRHVEQNVRSGGEIQLTTALEEIVQIEGAYALQIQGQRLDMGTALGYIETQLALARKGVFARNVETLIRNQSE